MNKATLVENYHSKFGGTKADAESAIDFVFDSIKEAILAGEKVSLAGFGIFTKKEVKARTARNPRTGELVEVASHSKVKFAVAKAFKDAVK